MTIRTNILNKKDRKGDTLRKSHAAPKHMKQKNVKMLGKKCNVMTGSKDCGKSHISVNK